MENNQPLPLQPMPHVTPLHDAKAHSSGGAFGGLRWRCCHNYASVIILASNTSLTSEGAILAESDHVLHGDAAGAGAGASAGAGAGAGASASAAAAAAAAAAATAMMPELCTAHLRRVGPFGYWCLCRETALLLGTA